MVIFLLTFIYILIFEEFKIDMRFYLMLFIILMAAYRASKKLEISVFNFLDFYPIKITPTRVLELLSSILFFLYLYIRTNVPFNAVFLITLFTFSIFFYYFLFRNISD